MLDTQFFMDDDASTRWYNGGAIEVKGAKELDPGRQPGVEVQAMEEVQSKFGLQDQVVPEVNGKTIVGTAEAVMK